MEDTQMTTAIGMPRYGVDRALGLAGIIAGAVVLLGFLGLLVEPPPGTHDIKIIIYCLGAAAVAIGVHRRQAPIAPAVVMAVTVAVVLANLWYVVRVLLPYGPWHPFVNDGGAAWLVTGVALWTTDAAFGIASAWLARVTQLGALALAIGSVLAVTGMADLGLTSEADPTIFMPLSLIGIGLNGIGWILIGLDIMTGGRPVLSPGSALAR
jgi:hypothetical protein